MKNKLKALIALCLVLMMVLSISACKDGTKENSADEVAESQTETDELETDDSDSVYYSELSVENASDPINNNFRGINGVHMGWGFMPDPTGTGRTPLKQWQLDEEYDRIAYTMGVKQIRSFYTSTFAFDEESNAWIWDTEKNSVLKGFYESLKAWQDRDVEVGISPQWSLASFEGIAGDTGNHITRFTGTGFYVENDLEATLKNYRNFIKDTVLSLEANGIHNVKYLFAFTECNNTYLSKNRAKNPSGTAFENRDYERVCELYNKAITALDNGLKDAGKRDAYKIVGPCDNFRTDFDYHDPEQYSYMVKYTVENLADKVDIIGAHGGYSYASKFSEDAYYTNPSVTMEKTMEMAHAANKEFWIDEYNVKITEQTSNDILANREVCKDPFTGVALGATINSILNMGANNVFLWQLADIQWPNDSYGSEFYYGLQINGFLRSPTESMTPFPSYYSASLLTRYIGSGKVYNCIDDYGLYISCVQRTDGEWTVIVTNYNISETPIHVNFEKSMKRKNFYRHLYDANDVTPTSNAEIIGVSAVAKKVTTGFYDTLPPYSVAVYTTVKD